MPLITRFIPYIKKLGIVPRWFIFLLDLAVSVFAVFLAFLVRNNLVLAAVDWQHMALATGLILGLNVVVFLLTRTYRGIVRYTGIGDAVRLFQALMVTVVVLFLMRSILPAVFPTSIFSNLFITVYGVMGFVFMLSYRVAVKQAFLYIKTYRRARKQVVIFGAGEAGDATRRVLAHDPRAGFTVLAFVDDDERKAGKSVDGVQVMNFERFMDFAVLNRVDELIIAIFSLTPERKSKVVDFCLEKGIKVLVVPPYRQWSGGTFAPRQLRNLRIEELLEREPIVIENDQVVRQIKGRRILVTGAAGSIGSEIARQVADLEPALLVLCDQAETPLHDLMLELGDREVAVNFKGFLASVNDKARMEELFGTYRPEVVYHAAAYKHVPMMEDHPVEAVRVNVLGTRQVADLAVQHGVDKFVMISTDKAVNPTSVMGATKRLAEMYVQGLSGVEGQATRFVTTRFGNVLGSNGSVVLRFREQIEKGGPVTVTHPDITRYFMTIPEACRLVLEAGSMGAGSEIFVFEMGAPVKITDLAKKMIRLYGLVPDRDIRITFTGLRPGEKLFEELLGADEQTAPTYHEKIRIAKMVIVELKEFRKIISDLEGMTNKPLKQEIFKFLNRKVKLFA